MTNVVSAITDQITTASGNVTSIFVVMAGVVGLFLAWRLIKRAAGR